MRSDDINDMDRFVDPCDDNRTDKQIRWEGDDYSPSGVKARLVDSFGEFDIAQLGALVAAFLILSSVRCSLTAIATSEMFVWLGTAVAAVLITHRYIKGIRGKRPLTKLNIAFIALIGVLFILLRGGLGVFLEQWGVAALDTVYVFIYAMFGDVGAALRLIISLIIIIYAFCRICVDRAEYIAAAVMTVSAVLGIVYLFMPLTASAESAATAYRFFAFFSLAFMLISCIVFKKSDNKYLHRMTIVFCILSMSEIYGIGWR